MTIAVVIPQPEPAHRPVFQFMRRLFREKPLGAFGAVIFVLFLLCGLFADVLAPGGYNAVNPAERFRPPSLQHLLGTDNLGRDMTARVIHGAQLSMIIGLCGAALATVISVLIGALSGYFRGWVDMIVQRFVDAWMSFPDLVILIVVVSVVGPGIPQIICILGLLNGIAGSRVIRGAVLSVREHMYIHAAQSSGATAGRILVRHVLPNIAPTVIVLFTIRVGAIILAESSLSFLGLGVPPPAPTWGGMLSGTGRNFMHIAPWLAIVPGLCLTLVVYGVNVFGDALRDLLDPRMRGAR